MDRTTTVGRRADAPEPGTPDLFKIAGVALRRLVAIGLLAALYQSCYFAAVSLTTVSLATLVTLGNVAGAGGHR